MSTSRLAHRRSNMTANSQTESPDLTLAGDIEPPHPSRNRSVKFARRYTSPSPVSSSAILPPLSSSSPARSRSHTRSQSTNDFSAFDFSPSVVRHRVLLDSHLSAGRYGSPQNMSKVGAASGNGGGKSARLKAKDSGLLPFPNTSHDSERSGSSSPTLTRLEGEEHRRVSTLTMASMSNSMTSRRTSYPGAEASAASARQSGSAKERGHSRMGREAERLRARREEEDDRRNHPYSVSSFKGPQEVRSGGRRERVPSPKRVDGCEEERDEGEVPLRHRLRGRSASMDLDGGTDGEARHGWAGRVQMAVEKAGREGERLEGQEGAGGGGLYRHVSEGRARKGGESGNQPDVMQRHGSGESIGETVDGQLSRGGNREGEEERVKRQASTDRSMERVRWERSKESSRQVGLRKQPSRELPPLQSHSHHSSFRAQSTDTRPPSRPGSGTIESFYRMIH